MSYLTEPRQDKEPSNPAIRLYGRRFYKDQTPVEYLAEFLLVFASKKGANQTDQFHFNLNDDQDDLCYWPEDRIGLKLFVCFPSSKLATRHFVHHEAYKKALHDIQEKIQGSQDVKEESVRLLQSLLSGFVGVSGNRTWATNTFFPASYDLLAREVDWLHTKAKKENIQDWDSAQKYFALDRHNFLARGGELLFLQIVYLFSPEGQQDLEKRLLKRDEYFHLSKFEKNNLKNEIEKGLLSILEGDSKDFHSIVDFIQQSLGSFRLTSSGEIKKASLGWVPKTCSPEAFLFACELRNICMQHIGSFEKLQLIQTLCCMQVLRTLCFEARIYENPEAILDGFVGGYSWIVSDPNSPPKHSLRKIAQNSFEQIEEMLYRVLRMDGNTNEELLKEADQHGLKIFKKIGKSLGLVIPLVGSSQRFSLPPHLLRFLVAALVEPGQPIRLTEFFRRVFAHYGIALGDKTLSISLTKDKSIEQKDYVVISDTGWIEETLKQGGLLVELSDSISIVRNPEIYE